MQKIAVKPMDKKVVKLPNGETYVIAVISVSGAKSETWKDANGKNVCKVSF